LWPGTIALDAGSDRFTKEGLFEEYFFILILLAALLFDSLPQYMQAKIVHGDGGRFQIRLHENAAGAAKAQKN
jgi:hypothetical protein